MANTYAANFGDVVKHTVLCEVLERERPVRYLESHAGRLEYDLADLDPGPGGVWDFIERSAGNDALGSSAYAEVIRNVAGTRARPGKYPGSVAFADALLSKDATVVAFELVAESASNLLEGLVARGRSAMVHVADGLSGVCESARPDDLVLLDPFHVHERGQKFTAAEAFATLTTRDVRTLLWYAVYEPTESAGWVAAVVDELRGEVWHARLVGESAEGGLAGCGFLAAHLSHDTVAAASGLVNDLARALAVVRPGLRLES